MVPKLAARGRSKPDPTAHDTRDSSAISHVHRHAIAFQLKLLLYDTYPYSISPPSMLDTPLSSSHRTPPSLVSVVPLALS